jgi:cytochrome P450
MGALLLAGGLDTVAGMMSFIMIFLSGHEAHRARLIADPAIIPTAVEELMRRHQTANIARVVTHDIVYKGVAMQAGDMVLTPTSMAGLDDRRYANPYEVDFDRADKKSLVFGRGPHQCIGAFLARTEIRVFLAEWLRRIPNFAIKPGEKPVVVPGRGNSVHYLPLVWTPAP